MSLIDGDPVVSYAFWDSVYQLVAICYCYKQLMLDILMKLYYKVFVE